MHNDRQHTAYSIEKYFDIFLESFISQTIWFLMERPLSSHEEAET